jgi:2-hydroxycyclohexanecarboxyl-CoA dehydrogenase
MDLGLQGKVALVTGATSNIGRATALALAGEGACVVASGRDEAAGARVVSEALGRGAQNARFMAADLLQPEAGDQLAASVVDAFGTIDILVNGVGGNNAIGRSVVVVEGH